MGNRPFGDDWADSWESQPNLSRKIYRFRCPIVILFILNLIGCEYILDNPPPKPKKSFRVSKPSQPINVSHKWTLIVIALSFTLSFVFSAVTSTALASLNMAWAFVVLFLIVFVNVLFDIIGTAVATAEESPFHSLASRKAPGAKESIIIIRHAPQVSNLCNDVIGDIAGIISGGATALIVTKLTTALGLTGLMPSLMLTGAVSSLTIGGKAFGKGISMKNCNRIIFFIGKLFYYLKCTRRK